MTDVCILIPEPFPSWAKSADRIREFKEWIIETMDPATYYFPNRSRKIHFASEEDLTVFTIKFGRVYTIVDSIDLSRINKMIDAATHKERYGLD